MDFLNYAWEDYFDPLMNFMFLITANIPLHSIADGSWALRIKTLSTQEAFTFLKLPHPNIMQALRVHGLALSVRLFLSQELEEFFMHLRYSCPLVLPCGVQAKM